MVELGERLTLTAGGVGGGGVCVARHDGQVFFLTGTLPGERVVATVRQVNSRFGRADVIDVLDPSPDRVPHVWPLAAAGGVGGAELGHVALGAQREWKRQVIADQCARLAGIDWAGAVEAAPGDEENGGLGWRTRIDLVADDAGRLGMFAQRSHAVVPLDDIPIADEAIAELDPFAHRLEPGARLRLLTAWGGGGAAGDSSTAEAGSDQERVCYVLPDRWDGQAAGIWAERVLAKNAEVRQLVPVGGALRSYRVPAAGFWQAHREAPRLLASVVLAELEPVLAAGGTAWDLYAGSGLFTAPIAELTGPLGRVLAVEGDRAATVAARQNASDLPQVRVLRGDVAKVAASRVERPDVVVLDPPRAGAGPAVMDVLAGRHVPRLVYVSCDPATLARDVGRALATGYELTGLRAFDLFPHTHHVEAVAVLDRR